MKRSNRTLIMAFATLAMLALASCEKNEPLAPQSTTVATCADEMPYIEVFSVEKNYYSVGVNGHIYTSEDLLYSKIHAKVSLTKLSKRKATIFSLQETETDYVVTAKHLKAYISLAKETPSISTSDPNEITKWVLEATLERYEIIVCYEEETGLWHGNVIEKE